MNDKINELKDFDLTVAEQYLEKLTNASFEYAPKVIGAVVIFFVGRFIIKYINKAVLMFFKRADFDGALESFIQSFISMGLKIALFVIIVMVLGVEGSSFFAAFGAMVFAVGMALQGSLSNFAGGVLILFFKPFRIDDFITSGGHSGTVVDIQIFNTILKTPEGIKIILPNGPVSNDTVINKTDVKNRRVDLPIGISYSDNIQKARSLMEGIAHKDDRILKDEDIMVYVANLGDNAVELNFRFWTKKDDFWTTRCDILEEVKNTFDKENISFPFPQRDIHIYNEK